MCSDGVWVHSDVKVVDVSLPCEQSGEVLKKVKEHTKQINDIQSSVDLTMVITASKDNSAKVTSVLPLE